MNNKNPDKLFIEVLSTQRSPYQDLIPSASDPMGEIQIRGRALRALGGGNVRWWVLISGWLIFGGLFLSTALVIISTHSYVLIGALAIAAIPLVPMWKGTIRKFVRKNQRSQ
jgi:hypothetical protein